MVTSGHIKLQATGGYILASPFSSMETHTRKMHLQFGCAINSNDRENNVPAHRYSLNNLVVG